MPAKRALLVIDVQNEYVTGKLPIEYPDVATSLANIGRAMDAARAAAIPVVIVQSTAGAGMPIFARGSEGWQLHEAVASRGWDHLVEKTLPSALTGTGLREWLAERAIDTITVCGYMTHNCDDATIREAVHTNLAAEFLVDASGSLPYANRAGSATAEEIHRAFAVVMQSRFAAVLTTAEWIAAIASGALPERDNIFASNQRARRT